MTIGNLTWDTSGSRYYYTGIDAVILYPWASTWYGNAVAWNGVTAINESPSGAESNKFYADNIEYLNLLSKEEFGCTLECYQVPEGFDPCDGIVSVSMSYLASTPKIKVRGQTRKPFGLFYRVLKGSDTVEAGGQVAAGKGKGYVYHFVYGCKASPSSRDFATVNDSPEAQTFSYEISTTPLTDNLPSGITDIAHIEIDCSEIATNKFNALNEHIFGNGSGGSNPIMPTPAQLVTWLA